MKIVEASRFCEKAEELIKAFPEYTKQFGLNIQNLKLQVTKEKQNILSRVIEVIEKEKECFIEYKERYKTIYIRLYDLKKTCSFELLVKEYKLDRKTRDLVLLDQYKVGPGCLDIRNENINDGFGSVMDMIYSGTIISKPY